MLIDFSSIITSREELRNLFTMGEAKYLIAACYDLLLYEYEIEFARHFLIERIKEADSFNKAAKRFGIDIRKLLCKVSLLSNVQAYCVILMAKEIGYSGGEVIDEEEIRGLFWMR